ncbi:hypothetical protein BDZ85DRAFT_45832 [Elsinoe ampelina]|uniref:Uncharacterized protein n=1 Tax=Elsinoe ampelina TaxID=302913 RepID=A0A6A6G1S1_9PEZI|nr:hypothetical protein BDZ85DRAFT_45832 [Elsinoe ampelina]
MSGPRGYTSISWDGGPGLCLPASLGGQPAFGYAMVWTHEDTNTITHEVARWDGRVFASPLSSIRLIPRIRPCSSLTEGFGPGGWPQDVSLSHPARMAQSIPTRGLPRRPSLCLSSTQVIKPRWAPTKYHRKGQTHAHQVSTVTSSSWRASMGPSSTQIAMWRGRTGTWPRHGWPDADEIGPECGPG